MMTGTTNDGASDRAAIIAGERDQPLAAADGALAQLPQMARPLGASGQLDALLSGQVLEWSDHHTESRGWKTVTRFGGQRRRSKNVPKAKELYEASPDPRRLLSGEVLDWRPRLTISRSAPARAWKTGWTLVPAPRPVQRRTPVNERRKGPHTSALVRGQVYRADALRSLRGQLDFEV